jgi:hypothetical protein
VKLLALFMGFLIGIQMTYCPVANAAASAMSVTSGGGVQGQLPCNKIGALLLADGVAIMNGTTIEVTGKAQDGKSQSQLHGKIFKVEQVGGNINGSAFFEDGPGLATLMAANCSESVKLNDGSLVKGPIDSITQDAVSAGGRSIPMSQVLKIHSAKVFNFHMKNERISFEATCLHAAASTKTSKTSSGDHFWQQHPFWTVAIIAGVGCGIACAIAIPVALANRGHHNNQQQTLNNIALIKAINARNAPVVTQPVANVVAPTVTRTVTPVITNTNLQNLNGPITINAQGFPVQNGVLLPSP